MEMSNYYRNQLRDHEFRTATYAKPTVQAIGLIYANRGRWQASTSYSLNDIVVPLSGSENGRYYRCTTAGTSGGSQPTWPTADGGTVADGTVVWTEQTLQIKAGTFPEVANAGAYARVTRNPLDANWSAPSDGLAENAAIITFPTATADWGLVIGVIVLDNATYGSGNLKMFSLLNAYQLVLNGNTINFNAGQLDLQYQ